MSVRWSCALEVLHWFFLHNLKDERCKEKYFFTLCNWPCNHVFQRKQSVFEIKEEERKEVKKRALIMEEAAEEGNVRPNFIFATQSSQCDCGWLRFWNPEF